MSDIDNFAPQFPSVDTAGPDDQQGSGFKVATRLVHAGSNPARFDGAVNTPIYRASTLVSQNLAELRRKQQLHASGERGNSYGRFGTPTTYAFEDAVAELEGAFRGLVFPSGLAACACALTAFVGKDDHILVPESAYFPLRNFARNTLTRFGVQVEFYPPSDVAGAIARMRENTRVLYLESPGSITFEVQDIPALAEAAHKRGAVVLMDNSWATPLYFKPFEHGVDVSIQAGTKYLVGHSDAFLGVVTATREAWEKVQHTAWQFGQIAGPDDVYLGLRGLRTLQVRLERHWHNGIELAGWLKSLPLVQQVLHPALPSSPDYALWKRDFTGASGLFAFQLAPLSEEALSAFFDHLELFKLGYSWGGFESLIMLYQPHEIALASRMRLEGPLVRIHAGLEDVDDLRADLHAAFKRVGG
jgi:cysteine-S-conjugate beta-lyase